MNVEISELMGESSDYWYKAKEIYKVIPYTAISYKVKEGFHQGKIIYKGHCNLIND